MRHAAADGGLDQAARLAGVVQIIVKRVRDRFWNDDRAGEMDDGINVVLGDEAGHEHRVTDISNDQPGICVTVDRKGDYDEDDMKVVEEGGLLKAIGKRLDRGGVNAESIGLLAFRAGGAERFREAIEGALRTPEGTTIWYLRVIHQIAQSEAVHTLDISGEEWGEVDFPQDVEAARALTKGWDKAKA